MSHRYHALAFTPSVKAAQERLGSRSAYARLERQPGSQNATLGPDEVEFITTRDHLFLATVSETGWPYVQHRGGPTGFVRVLDDETLVLPDYAGNRQHVTLGNLANDGRVSLFLWDPPSRSRLKLFGRAREAELEAGTPVAKALASPLPGEARPQRAFLIHVEGFDWNCPKYITPRFTEEEVRKATAPLLARLEQLEAENARLRAEAAART